MHQDLFYIIHELKGTLKGKGTDEINGKMQILQTTMIEQKRCNQQNHKITTKVSLVCILGGGN